MTTDHVDNLFPKWVKGELTTGERRRLDNHVADCERCRQIFHNVREDFALFAARGPARSPSDSLRQRILDDLEPGARFHDLDDTVAELLDISPEASHELFASIDDASNWVPVSGHDFSIFSFPLAGIEPGEEVDAEVVSIIEVDPGGSFPEHRHIGRERVFVLQGELVEDDGRQYERGEMIEHEHDTSHAIRVPNNSPPLIGIVLVEKGLEIGGVPLEELVD